MQLILVKVVMFHFFLGIPCSQKMDILCVNGINYRLLDSREANLDYKLHEGSELVLSICLPQTQDSAWNIIEEDWLVKGMKLSCGDSLETDGSIQRSARQVSWLQVMDIERAWSISMILFLPLVPNQRQSPCPFYSSRQNAHCLLLSKILNLSLTKNWISLGLSMYSKLQTYVKGLNKFICGFFISFPFQRSGEVLSSWFCSSLPLSLNWSLFLT